MKNYKVIWTVTAKKDLEEIIEYISNSSIPVAIEKYETIKKEAKNLELFPNEGRIIPELAEQNITKYKELVISPWRLMYKIDENKVFVMAVIDGRRNVEDILLRRQIR